MARSTSTVNGIRIVTDTEVTKTVRLFIEEVKKGELNISISAKVEIQYVLAPKVNSSQKCLISLQLFSSGKKPSAMLSWKVGDYPERRERFVPESVVSLRDTLSRKIRAAQTPTRQFGKFNPRLPGILADTFEDEVKRWCGANSAAREILDSYGF